MVCTHFSKNIVEFLSKLLFCHPIKNYSKLFISAVHMLCFINFIFILYHLKRFKLWCSPPFHSPKLSIWKIIMHLGLAFLKTFHFSPPHQKVLKNGVLVDHVYNFTYLKIIPQLPSHFTKWFRLSRHALVSLKYISMCLFIYFTNTHTHTHIYIYDICIECVIHNSILSEYVYIYFFNL